MRKRHSGSRFGAAAVTGVVLLCIACWGFTGCGGDSAVILSEENKITAFKIGDTLGAISEEAQEIVITVPGTTDLKTLAPVVTVSSNATVSPESGAETDCSHPVSYTVTAENGVTRTYRVTVILDTVVPTLESIAIRTLPVRTIYEIGEPFDSAGLVVIGTYSDGSVREETVYILDPSPVLTTEAGEQEVTISVDGKTAEEAVFVVTVRPVRLESISVTALKTSYAYGEALDPATDIVVTGWYSDGSTQVETVPAEAVTGYDPQKEGSQTVLVTLNGKVETYSVYVGSNPGERKVSVTVGLPNDDDHVPGIFGVPEGGIKLSTSQNDLPDRIIISAGGYDWYDDKAVYTSVVWYVDGVSFAYNNNIITLYAQNYTLKIPHYITFVGVRDDVEYSRTIEFTVEK